MAEFFGRVFLKTFIHLVVRVSGPSFFLDFYRLLPPPVKRSGEKVHLGDPTCFFDPGGNLRPTWKKCHLSDPPGFGLGRWVGSTRVGLTMGCGDPGFVGTIGGPMNYGDPGSPRPVTRVYGTPNHVPKFSMKIGPGRLSGSSFFKDFYRSKVG